jgi:PAS domain S-box-containing protein
VQYLLRRLHRIQRQLGVLSTPDMKSVQSRVFEALPFMMWSCDAEGKADYLSKKWLKFRGRRLREELGLGWTEGVHPEDRDAFLNAFKTAFEVPSPQNLEARMLGADGKYHSVLDVGVPRLDSDGKFTGYIGAVVDISEIKFAESYLAAVHGVIADADDDRDCLTHREQEILGLIAEGLTNAEIAGRLRLSPATVETHRNHILHRLSVKNTAVLIRKAIRLGLLAP